MMSSTHRTCPPGPAASRAVMWLRVSRTAAPTTAPPGSGTAALRASRVFTTWASPASPSGGSTSTAFAVRGLSRASTVGSVVRPLRQMILVVPVSVTQAEISSSISTLSFGARTATAERRWLALAATSSPTTGRIWSDQPSTTVCPVSSTVEWPRRRDMMRRLMPVVIRLTRVDTKSSATRASVTEASTYGGEPTAPPILRVCPTLTHTAVSRPERVAGAARSAQTSTVLAGITTARQARASQPMSAVVPPATRWSKRYRRRSRRDVVCCCAMRTPSSSMLLTHWRPRGYG